MCVHVHAILVVLSLHGGEAATLGSQRARSCSMDGCNLLAAAPHCCVPVCHCHPCCSCAETQPPAPVVEKKSSKKSDEKIARLEGEHRRLQVGVCSCTRCSLKAVSGVQLTGCRRRCPGCTFSQQFPSCTVRADTGTCVFLLFPFSPILWVPHPSLLHILLTGFAPGARPEHPVLSTGT